ncbi:MAG: DUF11 domain-containing protein [Dehalococcoidia bacterium]
MNGTVTCTGGTLASGATATITLIVVSPFTPGTISNSATVDPGALIAENVETNNVAPAAVTNVLEKTKPDLRLTATAVPGTTPTPPPGSPVPQGQNLLYTITVFNDTPGAIGDAENVRLHATLPTGSTFVSASGSSGFVCTLVAGEVQCTGATIPVTGSATIQVTVTVTAPPGTIVLSATADPLGTVAETDESNNTVTLSTTVIPSPVNLVIGKSADVATVGPQGVINYTLMPQNIGASARRHPSPRRAAGRHDLRPRRRQQRLHLHLCHWRGHLCRGQSPDAGRSGEHRHPCARAVDGRPDHQHGRGTRRRAVPESNESDNTSPPVASTSCSPDLRFLTPSATPATNPPPRRAPVPQGQNLVYTLAVINDALPATGDVSNVRVHTTLPAGVTYLFLEGSNGFICTNVSGVVQCTGATIAAGATATIRVTVNVTAALGLRSPLRRVRRSVRGRARVEREQPRHAGDDRHRGHGQSHGGQERGRAGRRPRHDHLHPGRPPMPGPARNGAWSCATRCRRACSSSPPPARAASPAPTRPASRRGGGVLPAGNSATITITALAPNSAATLTNTAEIDPGNLVPEFNEGDGVFSRPSS